ncbi:insulinase family protein [Desemzia sp. RIT804]|uniref:EF-P 5-aminopentanol modification-associated protein YfmF n=1 Tax=Desemzia sp. RIT 804 TaxID=2810209 RepID=UPI00194DBDD7|nr:pitrilysin family protein [Desemzia sp. RIT 804]MBM6613384.1 insulinase family protein [Desemzia sp. RIT 804]
MVSNLAKGVHLHVLPTKKYKTIQISLKFKTPLKKEVATKRTLIASLLEVNSKKYPNQTALRSKLSELYGAGFGTNVSKKGSYHIFSVSMSLVNDKFISMESNLLEEATDFLKEILFYPNAENGSFNNATFNREKEKLADDYDSLLDDKQTYAKLALLRLLFEDEKQQVPSIGMKADLESITSESLFNDYQELLANDEIDIYVLGDVTEEKVAEVFSKFEFQDRLKKETPIFYNEEAAATANHQIESQEITQAKYNLGYTTPVFYLGEHYYSGQVFNGLFGGYPHSKLFMNVREKESLAYYASSSLDTFNGTMVVQTGIDSKEVEKVKEIISQQLIEMQKGNFSQEDLQQTKSMLKNNVIQSEDNPGSVIERTYANHLALGRVINTEEWISNLEQVTKEEVIAIAKQVQLKATFFLTGGTTK